MNIDYIASRLPAECPERVRSYSFGKHLDQLGGHLGIYKRVPYREYPALGRVMEPGDWKERRMWAAEITCSCCGDSWHTAWVGGPMKAIAVLVGEDGVYYPLSDPEDPDAAAMMVEVADNDGVLCPLCGEGITLKHSSHIRNGMTRRLCICSVETVDEYAVLMYWLVFRYIGGDGFVTQEVSPWWAFALNEKGRMVCFKYGGSGWKRNRNTEDPMLKQYVSGDGNVYGYRYGGHVCDSVPDLIGTTAEKTGLGEYVRKGGLDPLLYLRTWKRKPAIENLVNAGWVPLIQAIFNRETNWGNREVKEAAMLLINWDSRKPHEMLHMTKEAYRQLDKSQNDGRSYEWLNAWHEYRVNGGKLECHVWDAYWKCYTQYGMRTVLDLMAMCPGLDIPKIDKYLNKQFLRPTEGRILLDTWKMTVLLTGRDALTEEERWPRVLQRRHDQLTAMHLKEKEGAAHLLYLAGFRKVLDKFGDLQWTDGELEIILPRDNGELVKEGEVLRHCVGTYGQSHVSESSVIFFVRRHRRPERSYYTLAMDMRGEPKRSQLHGYGNERHGDHKQYRHEIPAKVRAFCQRWEAEIVMPWYLGQQKQKKGRTA